MGSRILPPASHHRQKHPLSNVGCMCWVSLLFLTTPCRWAGDVMQTNCIANLGITERRKPGPSLLA
jgi:hypothetical protein